MTTPPTNAALFFVSDAYDLAGPKLMGRQAAGNGFLRAAVAARGDAPVTGYGPDLGASRALARIARGFDPDAKTAWLPLDNPKAFEALGVCHRADPAFGEEARLRMRVGQAAYSLTGVTHTLATSAALASIADLLREPVAEWDALVCTSTVALDVVRRVHEAEAEYLRWRFGPTTTISGPQLHTIPLGVHCGDFDGGDKVRARARREFKISDDEVVVLYAGRLLFHAKAHPFPLFHALQAARASTGKRVTLVFFGMAPAPEILDAFKDGARQFAPDVRTLFLDGKTVDPQKAWACADVFASLADSVQETFGLTPIEAMAAGLPCVVSDWNGYKDTVRDRVDGFRIRTLAPIEGAGDVLARSYEGGSLDYGRYSWSTASSTTVDLAELAARFSELILNPALRRAMGAAGRDRARRTFDWSVVFAQYQELWGELNARRQRVQSDPARMAAIHASPKRSASHPDPFTLFQSYPTATIRPSARVRPIDGVGESDFDVRAGHPLFSEFVIPTPLLKTVWVACAEGPATVREIAAAASYTLPGTIRAVGILAKLGLVDILVEAEAQ